MPVQCPECARFLSNAFVSGLRKGPAPCPKCEVMLRSEQFSEEHGGTADAEDVDTDAELVPTSGTDVPPATAPAPTTSSANGEAPRADADASVRPPDLIAEEVRGSTDDPLAGWDQPSNVVPFTGTHQRHDPSATGAAIGAGAAAGMLLGMAVSTRRVRGALLGGSLGAAAGAAAAQAMARRHEVDLIE